MFRQHTADRSERHSAVGKKDRPHAQNGGQVLIRLPLRPLLEITAQQAGDVFRPTGLALCTWNWNSGGMN